MLGTIPWKIEAMFKNKRLRLATGVLEKCTKAFMMLFLNLMEELLMALMHRIGGLRTDHKVDKRVVFPFVCTLFEK
ncbi:hypothetical protein Lal_00033406 [Lupinus albus]|nr:hypothetical protein Lal_00033406 [Lupinus albus]